MPNITEKGENLKNPHYPCQANLEMSGFHRPACISPFPFL